MAGLVEGIVAEMPIVTVEVLDADTLVCSICLKGLLGGNGFGVRIDNFEVDELKSRVMVQNDGCTPVLLFGECPLQEYRKI